MPRIKQVNASEADPKAQKLLDGVQKSLGVTPNLMATMAHSPAALQAYLSFGAGIGQSELSSAIREQIAVAIAGDLVWPSSIRTDRLFVRCRRRRSWRL